MNREECIAAAIAEKEQSLASLLANINNMFDWLDANKQPDKGDRIYQYNGIDCMAIRANQYMGVISLKPLDVTMDIGNGAGRHANFNIEAGGKLLLIS